MEFITEPNTANLRITPAELDMMMKHFREAKEEEEREAERMDGDVDNDEDDNEEEDEGGSQEAEQGNYEDWVMSVRRHYTCYTFFFFYLNPYSLVRPVKREFIREWVSLFLKFSIITTSTFTPNTSSYVRNLTNHSAPLHLHAQYVLRLSSLGPRQERRHRRRKALSLREPLTKQSATRLHLAQPAPYVPAPPQSIPRPPKQKPHHAPVLLSRVGPR